uniref:MABP domain-containing protein n=1 Tax=Cyprinus carpio TaxID=7962 RepID=A0A8C1QVY0_CYPCA
MSVFESSSASCRPITAVAWVSNSSACPGHFTLIGQTEDGASANFIRGFAIKSGYFLCYSKDLSVGMVVADVQVITDKETIPHGYSYIPEFLEHRASVGKKKRICVRIVPMGSVTTAVLDLKLTAKNKSMVQQYTCLGDINGFVVWCLKGQFSTPVPQAKPRRVSLDMRRLSLEGAGPPQPLRPRYPLTAVNVEHQHYGIHNDTRISCVSASTLSDIRIKSVQDIENEVRSSASFINIIVILRL